ncbi:DUF6244 family protein [Plantactinospora soyae]|uniref:Uncharacterized protein n=1 Tax=Plantactinospora soyae TaxID=1544732 RepID=A0A927M210_9ACTN|nr:DUF6244 family protein [Plantactinospora soyae]MBE1485382.1 hypothetical protein [Plantactinospora soyae]
MSNIEKIIGELGALLTGVERAQGQAAAAENQAREVAMLAAGSGFVTVAAGMARVRDAITGIQGRLGELAGLIGEASKATAAVPQGASPENTIAGLTPVQSTVDGARDAVAGTMAQVAEAQQLVTLTLQGGQPGPMLSVLEGIKQVLAQVAQRTGTARQFVDRTIAEARQLGASGN